MSDLEKYKSEKIEELTEYKKQLYLNYVDQVKTVNAYIIGVSSSATFAFFVLLYKFSSNINESIVWWVKVCTGLFLFSLFLIISLSIVHAIFSSDDEKEYANLSSEVKNMKTKEDIITKVDEQYNKIFKSKLYYSLEWGRHIAYIGFLLAIMILCILIFNFTFIEGV